MYIIICIYNIYNMCIYDYICILSMFNFIGVNPPFSTQETDQDCDIPSKHHQLAKSD